MYQTFVYHYMIMIGFYCHLGSYGKIMEHDHDEFLKVQRHVGFALVCFISFPFLYKLIVLLFFLIFRIWVKDFVCKMNVFW
jgi:hypothetical protein